MNGRIAELEEDAALVKELQTCMKLRLEECDKLRKKMKEGEIVTPDDVRSLLESIESGLKR